MGATPKLNTDGGPPTALFSFSLEREYELARRYTGTENTELYSARVRLADEVMRYRQTGILTDSLLACCDHEASLAGPWSSFGRRRIAELAADGHLAARERVEGWLAHPNAKVRIATIWGPALRAFDRPTLLVIAERMLSDRSEAVRAKVADIAIYENWFELVPHIRLAASCARNPKFRISLFSSWFHLLENQRTGNRGSFSSTEENRPRYEKQLAAFLNEACG